jgi:CRISPR-associated protein Cas2
MASRHLFLVGYDISENKRRSRALRDVQQHALAGQKSFYECWLSVAELQKLMAVMRSRIDDDTDRVVFIRLDGRSQSIQMGVAEPIAYDDYFYIE